MFQTLWPGKAGDSKPKKRPAVSRKLDMISVVRVLEQPVPLFFMTVKFSCSKAARVAKSQMRGIRQSFSFDHRKSCILWALFAISWASARDPSKSTQRGQFMIEAMHGKNKIRSILPIRNKYLGKLKMRKKKKNGKRCIRPRDGKLSPGSPRGNISFLLRMPSKGRRGEGKQAKTLKEKMGKIRPHWFKNTSETNVSWDKRRKAKL